MRNKRTTKGELLDHVCRECGGRVIQVIGHGPTGGGNPIFICSLCEKGSAATGPEVICWCGFNFRGQEHYQGNYMCLPFSILKEKPELLEAFRSCGCDPEGKGVVGIVTRDGYQRAILNSLAPTPKVTSAEDK